MEYLKSWNLMATNWTCQSCEAVIFSNKIFSPVIVKIINKWNIRMTFNYWNPVLSVQFIIRFLFVIRSRHSEDFLCCFICFYFLSQNHQTQIHLTDLLILFDFFLLIESSNFWPKINTESKVRAFFPKQIHLFIEV